MTMTLKQACLGVLATSLLAFGCDVDRAGVDPSGYYFTGTVYDGVTGEPVEAFKMTLSQASGTTTVDVKKGADGSFEIGPVKPGSDYVITIDAKNYRPFFDAEAMKAALPNNTEKKTTQYFEAYLFPTDIDSPAVTFEIFGQDNAHARPSGTVRFAPVGEGTSALNLGGSIAPAVSGQIWANDADRKAGTRFATLENGVVDVTAGLLVYGVAYQATVYAVDGHAYQSFNFTAGLTGHQTVTLRDLGTQDLEAMTTSLDDGLPSSDGTVTFTFNFPIEFAGATPESYSRELLDDNLDIDTVNANGNTTMNALTLDDEPDVQERRTEISIDGNTLTLKWPGHDDAACFETDMYDQEDLQAVIYDVRGIQIRRVGASDIEAATLSSLVGTTVTVPLKEPTN